MTPSSITVLIEGDDTERPAKLIGFSEQYHAGLYDSDGREFYVDPELIIESRKESKPVLIPLAVITHRENQKAKLEWAQNVLDNQAKEKETGIIVPDGFGS